MSPSPVPFASIALSLILLAACGGGEGIILPGDGDPAAIAVLDGDEQQGRVGEPLNDPLVVRVIDSRGRPVEGATVAFEFGSAGAGAVVVPQEKTTNGDGLADARLVLGTGIGRQTGQARVVVDEGRGPIQASFSAMALPENANAMAAVAGQDQTGHVGLPLDDRLVVEVTDGFGNPVAGVPISWVAVGGGSVSEAVVETDEDGRSRVDRILGPTVGPQTTLASSAGLAGSPVTFAHTALAGDASQLVLLSGNDQTGEVGSELPGELAVQLIDSDGNGVPQTAVSWVVATGGGVATPEISTTDGDGRTSARWTLGATLGQQRLDAVVSGVGIASFRATATVGPPASLFFLTQPSASARNGVPLPTQPVLQLRDSRGNDAAQAGVPVTAAIGSGGGELGGTSQVSTDASGQARFTDLSIAGAPGPRTLIFTAPGFAQVTSSEIEVGEIGTATTITGDSPDPSGPGAPFTVSFQVTSQGPTPTGSVTVSDGVQSCIGSLSSGAGSCPLSLTTVGGRTLTATYSGEPGLVGSSDTEPHTVTAGPPPPPAPTATTITADSPDPSDPGQLVSVSFTVTSASGTPAGTVTASDGAQNCIGNLSGGSGSCSLALTTSGPRTLTATYAGNSSFNGSSDTEPHSVNPPPPGGTTTTITGDSPDPSDPGQAITVSFTVTSASGTPTGTVQVTDGIGGGCSGSAPSDSCSFTPGGVGTRTITATYQGNAGFNVSSDTEDHTVTTPPAGTSTTITSDSPDPSDPGQLVSVNFTVTSGSGTPGGTVTVSDGAQNCSGNLAGGSGSCSLALTTSGPRTLTATYAGNSSFEGSSNTESHTVNPPPPGGTTTTITGDSPDPSDPGQAITVSFTVTSASGTPTGTVQVTDGIGGGCSGNAPSDSCGYTPSGVGTRTITASYQGNASFNASSDTEDHTVTTPPAGTSTTITSDSPEPSDPGEAISVSFTVTSASGTPTGTVQVTDGIGGGCSGSAPSDSCSYTPSGVGTRTITASYQGNASFNASSDTEDHTVTTPPAGTSTTITSDSPDPSDPGQSITVNFTVTSGSGTPAGTVTVSDGVDSCSDTFAGGSGGCSLALTTSGPRTLTATYAANSSFEGSADTEPHTVNPPPPAETTTTITTDNPDPSDPGQSVTVNFTVTSGSGTPAGTVTVSDGVDSCSDTFAGGSGSCPLALSTSGPRTLTATYAGNSSFEGSSDTESHTVNPPPPAETTTTITSISPEPSDPDADVTVAFTVTSSPDTPDGIVQITDSNEGGCSAAVSVGNCTYTPGGTGERTITATYEGTSDFTTSADTEQHTVSDVPPPGP